MTKEGDVYLCLASIVLIALSLGGEQNVSLCLNLINKSFLSVYK